MTTLGLGSCVSLHMYFLNFLCKMHLYQPIFGNYIFLDTKSKKTYESVIETNPSIQSGCNCRIQNVLLLIECHYIVEC
jgi:hypothetical protein